jgi:hypothetical protein
MEEMKTLGLVGVIIALVLVVAVVMHTLGLAPELARAAW